MLQAIPINEGYSRHRATPGAFRASAAKWRYFGALPAAALHPLWEAANPFVPGLAVGALGSGTGRRREGPSNSRCLSALDERFGVP